MFSDPPASAAWRHQDAREGFEVVIFHSVAGGGFRIVGHTSAVESGVAWAVQYEIDVDTDWATKRARVRGRSAAGEGTVRIESPEPGQWLVDGAEAPQLRGCLDVDLESSALTNAFPVHRLGLSIGDRAEAPAVYVRAADLGVERLEQRYQRVGDPAEPPTFDYTAASFGFEARLVYDEFGLVTAYPGLATRIRVAD